MKTITYFFTIYHQSDEKSFNHVVELIEGLKELLPDAQIEWESCKRDHGHLEITIKKIEPF